MNSFFKPLFTAFFTSIILLTIDSFIRYGLISMKLEWLNDMNLLVLASNAITMIIGLAVAFGWHLYQSNKKQTTVSPNTTTSQDMKDFSTYLIIFSFFIGIFSIINLSEAIITFLKDTNAVNQVGIENNQKLMFAISLKIFISAALSTLIAYITRSKK